jgi:hypothetical protein
MALEEVVEPAEGSAGIETGNNASHVDVERIAEDGARLDQRTRHGRCAVQLHLDEGRDAAGDRPARPEPGHLLHEHRVAAGLVEDPVTLRHGHVRHEFLGGITVEGSQIDERPASPGCPLGVQEPVDNRARSQRHRQQVGVTWRSADEVFQQLEGDRVRPVHVVEHEGHGIASPKQVELIRDRPVQLPPSGGGGGHVRVAQRWEFVQMRTEGIDDGRERLIALELGRMTVQHGESARRRPLAQSAEQARLTDPGLAADDDEPAVAASDGIDPVADDGELVVATHDAHR